MKLKLIYFLPFIISLLFLTVLTVQIYPHFLAVHDSPLKLLPTESLTPIFSFWSMDNFGYTNYLLNAMSMYPITYSHMMLKMSIPTLVYQLGLYFIILNLLMYASWFGIYKFLKLLGYKNSLWPAFWGSIFFSFNLYMITSWHGGTIDGLFLTYTSAPLLLYLFTKNILQSITVRDKAFYIILFTISLNTVPFAAAVILAFSLPFLYIKFINKQLISTIKNFTYISFFSLGLATFYLYLIILAFVRSDPHPLRNNAIAYAFSDYGLFGNFKMYLDWTINQQWGSRYFHSYFPYFNYPIIVASTFFIWFFILLGIIKHIKFPSKQIVGYLLTIITFSLLFTKSLNAPLGFINKFMYDYAPLMNLFRTPDTKFGLPLITAMSFLIGISLVIFQKNRILSSVVIVSILLNVGVFFTGLPLIERKVNEQHTRIVNLPKEYIHIANILNKDSNEGSVLMYPGLGYANYNYMNGSGLNGPDLLGKLIIRPKIYSDGFIFGNAENKYQTITKNISAKHLGENSIRYVLIRKDIYDMYPSAILQQISSKQHLKLISNSKIASLYEVNPRLYTPYISIKNNTKVLHFSSNEILPNVYKILIENPESNMEIQFNTSFHPDWKIYSSDTILINSHRANKNGNNQWQISTNQNQNVTLYMIFIPQLLFIIPIFISLLFFVVFIKKYILHKNAI